MRKFYIGLFLVLVVVLGFLIARGFKPKPKDNFTLKIGATPWIGNGVFYVAQDQGFYDREKINVEFINVDDFATARQLLQSGRVDAIYLTPETVAVSTDAGVRLKIVAANDLSFGADGIIATQNIRTIEDLKGKKVALEIGSTSHFLLSYLLNQKGLSTKDLDIVEEIAPDAGASFVAGKVDAAVTWEPWLSKASERGGGHLLKSSHDAPIVYDMPILRAEVVEQHRDEVRAFLRATFDAQKWTTEHKPEEVAQIIAPPLHITPSDAQAQMQGVRWLSYEENLSKITSGQYSIQEALQTAGDLWFKLGLIKNPIKSSELIDDSLLKNLYSDDVQGN